MGVARMSSNGKRYLYLQDRVIFVSPGLTNGSNWMTCYQKPNGSLRRVKSKFLPLRDCREKAQADLDRWARGRGLEVVSADA